MKKNKILLIILSLFIIIWTTYASWQAWGWVKWIWETDQSNRFTDYSNNTLDYWIWYYLDTYTWLKWAAQDSWNYLQWATNTSYTEPTWNWSSYTYPSWRISSDYPAFKYCTDLWDWWRLPTKREIFSIITDVKPSWMSHCTALPFLLSSNNYWSSTVNARLTSYAWYGEFLSGTISNTTKKFNAMVLCIHD